MAEPVIETYPLGDGAIGRYRRYEPDGPARGHLVLIHGAESHGGWYVESCTRWCAAGYRVSFLDRRGAGLDAEARGDTPGFRRLLDDLADFLKPLAAERPQRPVVLMAISWGGKLAVALMRRHPGLVDGLVLICPGLFPKVGHSFAEKAAILWARCTAPSRLFRVPIDGPARFTASTEGQRFIRDDPLALRQVTARFLIESVRLDYFIRFFVRAVPVPVLLLLAGRDRIIHNAPTIALIQRLGPPDLQVRSYADSEHTLEFEPARDQAIGDVLDWLRQRFPSAGPLG